MLTYAQVIWKTLIARHQGVITDDFDVQTLAWICTSSGLGYSVKKLLALRYKSTNSDAKGAGRLAQSMPSAKRSSQSDASRSVFSLFLFLLSLCSCVCACVCKVSESERESTQGRTLLHPSLPPSLPSLPAFAHRQGKDVTKTSKMFSC